MSARAMSHERCVQRVCCPSWSCTPHQADCPAIDDWARAAAPTMAGVFFPGLAKASLERALELDRERHTS